MSWKLLATDLPKVPVMDMLYEATSDKLVLVTLGRGVWFLENASEVVTFVLTGVTPPSIAGAEYEDTTIDFSSMGEMDQVPPDDAPFPFDQYDQIIP
jgi:hypothetical protein